MTLSPEARSAALEWCATTANEMRAMLRQLADEAKAKELLDGIDR